mmetsp:Transcript_23476/g.36164  ORF Transcript_23476/g.36164 Transcript_23476/m.36164 type:complete len:143 (-) Transcript_23476:6330-6758(-)
MNNSDGTEVYSVIYNGKNYPHVFKYTVASTVESGGTFTFKVQAINYNGYGADSSTLELTICSEPGFLEPPRLDAVTATTMTLRWIEPESDGGCAITSYSIYMDDGAGGSLVEKDASSVNNLPTLRTHQITFDSADTGNTYVF